MSNVMLSPTEKRLKLLIIVLVNLRDSYPGIDGIVAEYIIFGKSDIL